MTNPGYPEAHARLVGQDGNAFTIIGAATAALRRAGVPKEEVAAYVEEAMSGDYENVTATTVKWVSVS